MSDKRKITITIDSCHKCPYSRVDSNKTRLECGKNGERIWWDCSPEEEKGEIPEWCPIFKEQKKESFDRI